MSTHTNYIRPIAQANVAVQQGRMVLAKIDAGEVNSDPLLMAESLHNLADLVRPHDEDLARELMLAGDDFLQESGGFC